MFAITAASWAPATSSPGDILAQTWRFTGPMLGHWQGVSPGLNMYLSEAAVLESHFQTASYGAG